MSSYGRNARPILKTVLIMQRRQGATCIMQRRQGKKNPGTWGIGAGAIRGWVSLTRPYRLLARVL